jgi:four helix bundle protein
MNDQKDSPWRNDVQQMMLKVRHLAGILRSRNLDLLTDQLEQAGYRVLAHGHDRDAVTCEGDGTHYLSVARGCVREIEYQLLLAKETGVRDRRPYSVLHAEFLEIRRAFAAVLRQTRR